MKIRLIGILLLLSVSSGCIVQSLSPFYDKGNSVMGPQVSGLYYHSGGKSELSGVWEFSNRISPWGEAALPGAVSAVYFRVGDEIYVDVTPEKFEEDEINIYWMFTVVPAHVLMKFEKRGDEFFFIPMDPKRLSKILEEENLDMPYLMAGKEKVYNAPADEWKKFLEAHGDNRYLFPKNRALGFVPFVEQSKLVAGGDGLARRSGEQDVFSGIAGSVEKGRRLSSLTLYGEGQPKGASYLDNAGELTRQEHFDDGTLVSIDYWDRGFSHREVLKADALKGEKSGGPELEKREDGLLYEPGGEEPFSGVVAFDMKGEKWFEAEYSQGVLHGRYRSYKNSRKRREGEFIEGRKTGIWKTWAHQNYVIKETTFSGGERLGRETKFYEDGGKQSEGSYGEDGKEGEWLYWRPGGKLYRIERYRNGELVETDRNPEPERSAVP